MNILIQMTMILLCILIPQEPEYSHTDAELIAGVLYSECRGESRDGQKMVAQCIVDRLEEGHWGDDIESVIFSKNQFAKPGPVQDHLYEVAKEVLQGDLFNPNVKILYFRVIDHSKDWYAPYIEHIGSHAYYGRER